MGARVASIARHAGAHKGQDTPQGWRRLTLSQCQPQQHPTELLSEDLGNCGQASRFNDRPGCELFLLQQERYQQSSSEQAYS